MLIEPQAGALACARGRLQRARRLEDEIVFASARGGGLRSSDLQGELVSRLGPKMICSADTAEDDKGVEVMTAICLGRADM